MKRASSPGVSGIVKALMLAVLVGGVALLIGYVRRPAATGAVPPPSTLAGSPGSGGTAAPALTRATDRVTRISPAERRRAAERIASAQAARAPSVPALPTALPTAAPSLPPNADRMTWTTPTSEIEMRTHLSAAMKEVKPYLAACYETELASAPPGAWRVTAEMTLTGDPEVGTLIDPRGLYDSNGDMLPGPFDACVREALMSLQLPPFAGGGDMRVTYPFVFAQAALAR